MANAASATEAPIWRLVLRTPEARPAWVGATPDVAAKARGVMASPMPKVATVEPPNTDPQYEPVGPARASHSRPAALMKTPINSGRRGPDRVTTRELIWAPMAMAAVWGRKPTPVMRGEKRRTSCM